MENKMFRIKRLPATVKTERDMVQKGTMLQREVNAILAKKGESVFVENPAGDHRELLRLAVAYHEEHRTWHLSLVRPDVDGELARSVLESLHAKVTSTADQQGPPSDSAISGGSVITGSH